MVLGRMARAGACAAVVALAGSACQDGAGSGPATAGPSGCGPEVSEPLDPGSAQHVLPGAPEPRYPGPAPTSGPHQAGPVPTGAQDRPLPRPVQVALLEQGGVLVQHRDLGEEDRRRLEARAGGRLVVAPNPALPAPVVATAWGRRLECRGVDLGALDRFATRPGRHSPGH